jgi:hypothetical protein
MLQGYNECRLKSSFYEFYDGYKDLVCDYKFTLTECNIYTILILMNQMHMSPSVMLGPKNLEIQIVITVKIGGGGIQNAVKWSQIRQRIEYACGRNSFIKFWFEWFVSYLLLEFSILALTMSNPIFLISTKVFTCQQRMVTPPWHLILPSLLSGVRATLHSNFVKKFSYWLRLTNC